MIKNIIDDLKAISKISPNELLHNLIQERLQIALVTYYKDLDKKFDSYSIFIEDNTIKAAKAFLR